jgi:cytochrome c
VKGQIAVGDGSGTGKIIARASLGTAAGRCQERLGGTRVADVCLLRHPSACPLFLDSDSIEKVRMRGQRLYWRVCVVTIRAVTVSLSSVVCLLSLAATLPQNFLSQARADDTPQLAFNNACRTCHTVKQGDNRLGPSLFGIIGREAGSLPEYGYSSAMKNAGFAWDEAKLARFIANPDEVVPGNKMKPYGGLGSDDAKKIVAFLQSIESR